jgi:Cu+-exporting ATPase
MAGTDEAMLLGLVAGLEQASEHPLAAAILAGAKERALAPQAAAEFQSVTGKGVTGTIAGRRIAVGNEALISASGGSAEALQGQAEELRRDGSTVLFAAVDGKLAGLIAVSDPIKSTAADAIAELKREGLRILMLTGDNATTAAAVAAKLGIDFQAGLLPDQKAAAIRGLQGTGARVAMAGDGVNDAPALAQAQVGVAMGTGTDIAIETAGITLLHGDLAGLVRARRLSQATLRNIRQNLFFALVYNAVGIPLAAGVLYPVFGWLLSPMIGAAAMSLSSVSVIGNALRLRNARL